MVRKLKRKQLVQEIASAVAVPLLGGEHKPRGWAPKERLFGTMRLPGWEPRRTAPTAALQAAHKLAVEGQHAAKLASSSARVRGLTNVEHVELPAHGPQLGQALAERPGKRGGVRQRPRSEAELAGDEMRRQKQLARQQLKLAHLERQQKRQQERLRLREEAAAAATGASPAAAAAAAAAAAVADEEEGEEDEGGGDEEAEADEEEDEAAAAADASEALSEDDSAAVGGGAGSAGRAAGGAARSSGAKRARPRSDSLESVRLESVGLAPSSAKRSRTAVAAAGGGGGQEPRLAAASAGSEDSGADSVR